MKGNENQIYLENDNDDNDKWEWSNSIMMTIIKYWNDNNDDKE